MGPQPIILCPLRFELATLRRAGLGNRFALHCCGPGSFGIERWAAQNDGLEQPIILVGLAGAISNRVTPGSAVFVSEVIEDRTGTRWTPTLELGTEAPPCGVATSSEQMVTRHSERLELHARSGADLVDQESVPFARCASARGWKWAIVRGISDGLNASLPAAAHGWVDEHGRTRLRPLVRSIVRHPPLVHELFGLRKRSILALQAASEALLGAKLPSAR